MGKAFAAVNMDGNPSGPFETSAQNAMCCLNEMITDSLALMPRSLAYLRQLKDPSIFGFCAIPQLMVDHIVCGECVWCLHVKHSLSVHAVLLLILAFC